MEAGMFETAQMLFEVGRKDQAAFICRKILALAPLYSPTLNLIGVFEYQNGNIEEAKQYFRDLTKHEKDDPAAWYKYGVACLALGELEQARLGIDSALQLNPKYAEAWNELGRLHEKQGNDKKAEECFRHVLKLKPDHLHACNNLALVCNKQRKFNDSILWYRKSIEINPNQAGILVRLGENLETVSDQEGACDAYKKSLRLAADDGIRLKLATVLPVILKSKDEITLVRNKLWNNLETLNSQCLHIKKPWVNGRHFFYLTYHGLNDRAYHELLARIYRKSSPELTWQAPHVSRKREPGGRIRIGFISRFFCNHTIAKLNIGFVEKFDRSRFHITVLLIAADVNDAMTRRFKMAADQFVPLPGDLLQMREQVAACQLDVLLYTDIGMDPLSYFLAFSRLAPVQCVTWGHPATSGIDTIDYFISHQDCETEASVSAYSERLFCLSAAATCTCYSRPILDASDKPLEAFGIDSRRNVYYCPQPPFKIHPDFDPILAKILERDPNAIIVLLKGTSSQMEALLRQRFQKTIPEQKERIHFLDNLPFVDYIAMMKLAHVVLDTPHFSGGNSTVEGLAVGAASVTLPSAFSKARFGYAWYRKLGINDCIARDADDYVDIAVSLGTNRDLREHLQRRILEASPALFDDLQAVRELEAFLERVCIRN